LFWIAPAANGHKYRGGDAERNDHAPPGFEKRAAGDGGHNSREARGQQPL
jgi:hypothetical protein